MISIDTLIAAGITPTLAKIFATPLAEACVRFGINSPKREAAFISQCAHESAGLSTLEEGLYYTTPERIRVMWPSRFATMAEAAQYLRNPQALANRAYANRNGNGDEASGDGWRYRGRGLLQLTGRANYLAAEAAINAPYKSQPDLVQTPAHAAMTGAWFFVSAGCLRGADAGDVVAVTRAINGPALAGLEDRRKRYDLALEAFS
ncbi:glycoside hydrolase family 19 protein [Mitsuaria sp. WAJ17]|uniref:glycoside hydrolase family 19 protein n=1 Tax=Mitsuaria sp. WAJ17 TaxID=2761452 RepID=UPI0016016B84|nr:glycoside hydrolase family 19 protein [Mitsuaria sp. WAJ17]MBB2485392.1 glycoside hydrolase family 19 protein [Mitsuaria sp. WAJ17]